MTDKEIQDMPIEEIINLSEFVSLKKDGGYEYGEEFGYLGVRPPYWEVKLKATPHPDGYYLWGDLKIPHPTYIIFKIIK